MVRLSERLRPNVGGRRDTLANTGTVADEQKMHLAAGTAVVEPTLKGDFLADVTAQVFDISPRHRVRSASIFPISLHPAKVTGAQPRDRDPEQARNRRNALAHHHSPGALAQTPSFRCQCVLLPDARRQDSGVRSSSVAYNRNHGAS